MFEPFVASQELLASAATRLGLVGSSGNSPKPHLHIECVDEANRMLRPIPRQHKMVSRKLEIRATFNFAEEETARALQSDWRPSQRQGLAVVSTLIYPGDYQKFWNGVRWSGWKPLGGELTAKPAAVSWGPRRIDVFGRGWERLGGTLLCGSKFTSWATRRNPDLFGRATDGTLHQKYWAGSSGWAEWQARGRPTKYGPAVSSRAKNHLDVFVVAPDDSMQP